MADVASSFKNWSASAASNNPTSATVIGSGLAPNLQQIQSTLRTELGTRSAPVTAASTVDLNAIDEGTVFVEHISGTVSLSSFGTVQAGIKKLITFDVTAGTLTLVYNATSMIIPSSANIVVADGDSLLAESLGSGNWKIHWYGRSNGLPVSLTLLNSSNDPTYSSTSPSSAISPEWLIGFFDENSLGFGQTWQDVSASRTHTTTYTNSTGRPIGVCIGATVSTTRQVTVDGIIVGNFSSAVGFGQCSFIVPPDGEYRINGSVTSIVFWSELRT